MEIFRIVVSQRSPDKYLAILDICGEKSIKGEEVDAYVVYCTENQATQLKKLFSWIEKIELYDAFIIALKE